MRNLLSWRKVECMTHPITCLRLFLLFISPHSRGRGGNYSVKDQASLLWQLALVCFKFNSSYSEKIFLGSIDVEIMEKPSTLRTSSKTWPLTGFYMIDELTDDGRFILFNILTSKRHPLILSDRTKKEESKLTPGVNTVHMERRGNQWGGRVSGRVQDAAHSLLLMDSLAE